MSLQIHSVQSELMCSNCHSFDTGPAEGYAEWYSECRACGTIFVTGKRFEVPAVVTKCPHCESTGSIEIYGGEEQCQICGLDPNEQDYLAYELAHLWKRRDEDHEEGDKLIREVMCLGQDKFRPGSKLGDFLREKCGPHCNLASACPQTTRVFSRCFHEERETPEDEEVSKRISKGKRKAARAQRRKEQKAYKKLQSRAWLFAPREGWYVKTRNYVTETLDTEQSDS